MAMAFALMSSKRFKADNLDFIESIHSTIKGVLDGNLMTPNEVMKLHTQVINRCSSSTTQRFDFIGGKAVDMKTAVYELIRQSLEKHVYRLAQKFRVLDSEESLLTLYSNKYKEYEFSTKLLSHCFRFIENRTATDSVLGIERISKAIWAKGLLKGKEFQLSKTVFDLIQEERNGRHIDASVIKPVVDSYRGLECICDEKEGNLNVFQQFFGIPFLKTTEVYYLRERKKLLVSYEYDFSEYVEKCRHRLEEEEFRVKTCLHYQLCEPLIEIIERILVLDVFKLFVKQFDKELNENRVEGLKSIYQLVVKYPKNLMELSQHFCQYIKSKALESLKSNVDRVSNDPIEYITSIIAFYDNSKTILDKCFDSNPLFERQLSNTLSDILSRNAVTEKTENCNKSLEFLAKYFDDLLKKKKNGTNGENSDELIEKALILFRFSPNKDVFKEFHLRLLSFRLIHESSECYDIEKCVVSRLKEFCGTDYTNNMQKLFQDIECSEILNKEFNETEECIQSRIGFNIKVITESVQNFVQRLHQMNYPKEIQELEEKFRKFYFGKHSGRKLKFLYELSKGEIVAKFAKDYKINASALQITVLMQFNDCNEWSVNDLVSNTNIESNVLIEVLKTLLQKRLLCDERNKRKSLPFTQNSVIRVNDKFSRKNIRFSIYEDLKNEFEGLHKRTYERIGEQNRFKMESAIVKIMKTTKQLSHKVLVQEVIKKIDIKSETLENDIKIGINHLIGRDVLKRDDNSLDIYEYMA